MDSTNSSSTKSVGDKEKMQNEETSFQKQFIPIHPPRPIMMNTNGVVEDSRMNSLTSTKIPLYLSPQLMEKDHELLHDQLNSNINRNWIQPRLIIPNYSSALTKISWRKGKWLDEEEAYTKKLIEAFNGGYLKIASGTTLRSFLSEKLSCDPMRITKKFAGSSCIGKQVYSPCDQGTDPSVISKIQVELKECEDRFRAKVDSQSSNHHYTAVSSQAAAIAAAMQGFHPIGGYPISYFEQVPTEYFTTSVPTTTNVGNAMMGANFRLPDISTLPIVQFNGKFSPNSKSKQYEAGSISLKNEIQMAQEQIQQQYKSSRSISSATSDEASSANNGSDQSDGNDNNEKQQKKKLALSDAPKTVSFLNNYTTLRRSDQESSSDDSTKSRSDNKKLSSSAPMYEFGRIHDSHHARAVSKYMHDPSLASQRTLAMAMEMQQRNHNSGNRVDTNVDPTDLDASDLLLNFFKAANSKTSNENHFNNGGISTSESDGNHNSGRSSSSSDNPSSSGSSDNESSGSQKSVRRNESNHSNHAHLLDKLVADGFEIIPIQESHHLENGSHDYGYYNLQSLQINGKNWNDNLLEKSSNNSSASRKRFHSAVNGFYVNNLSSNNSNITISSNHDKKKKIE